MRYTVYRVNSDGSPGETILETDDRNRMLKTVGELILDGETHETIRVKEDLTMPEPSMGGFFY